MKKRPLLQIALDNLTIEEAVTVAKKIEKYIDVIEVGTILISSEGTKAIKVLKAAFPDKIIVADGKIADAGAVFGKMFFEAGAHYTTCICAAEDSTMKQTVTTAKKYGQDKEVQVELTRNFTWEQAASWAKQGVQQAVWHRARDLQADGTNWSKYDMEAIAKLVKLGYKVTVTGGLVLEDIKLFKDFPIYIFVAGRSIRDAANPELAAKEMQDEIGKYWK